ncbi:non-reducing end alpha-L-arabinofuranosidase family hydrolase [Sorangium sp. So ce1153]|uniref:non-reducing end alpha-L-arabinofuranosidase family hydrolase n=1 Tax=Sorangium sp. So ce1153 TaxID=3133333 RepID=UPI003F5EA4B1
MRITRLLGFSSASVACCLLACSAGLSDGEDGDSLGSALSSPDGAISAEVALESQWGSGYCANVTVKNTSTGRTTSWGVVVGLNGSTLNSAWNARVTASSGQLNAVPEAYNGTLDPGASTTWGFCASGAGRPAIVSVSGSGGSGASAGASSSSSSSSSASSSASSGAGSGGAAGTGGGGAGSGSSTSTGAGGGGGAGGSTGSGCGVPTSFEWTSSPPLITPPSGAASIKDPTVLFHDGKWHVYATQYAGGYNMTYLNFTDWNQAGAAAKTSLSTNPNLTGYKCAPQLFYFAPQRLWYLVYQTQPPAYSTSTNPSDVRSWSAPRRFFSSEPAIVTANKGSGTWIDFWVICDDASCYLFFSDDNGHLYRSKTSKSSFPNGFGTPVIALSDSRFALFEAANVYKMKGTDKYLLIHEAIGDGRYFRSWTADRLDGAWTPLAATQANPFASKSNVTGAGWSNDGISHGEMLRDNPDETMTIDTCNMRYLFQGRTRAGSTYDLNEYSLGVLTAVP